MEDDCGYDPNDPFWGEYAKQNYEEGDWRPIETAPENIEVETKIHDKDGCRNIQSLRKQGNLWYFPDMSMYVYYRPTHWRELQRR